jgi:tetratricopeptide (TPR) repeat protein
MNIEKKHLLILLFILIRSISISYDLLAQDVDYKFPLYRIGIKIQKPKNYFLLTSDNVNKLKEKSYNVIDVCSESKMALDIAMGNPNYQVIINESNSNEIITFIKFPKFSVDKDLSELLLKKLKEHCYFIKDLKIETLSLNSGSNQIGNFVSLLNKITTPELSYYSEAFFFETRNSTITLTINSIEEISNTDFINSFEYINNDQYEKLLEDFTELFENDDLISAKEKLSQAINREPKNVMAYEKRAELNLKLNNYNQVIEDANEILNINPININGHLMKGLALYNKKEYEEAIKCLKDAQFYYSILTFYNAQNEYFDSFAAVYRITGEAYLNLKEASNAAKYLLLALEISEDSLNTASIYYNLGVVKSTFLKCQ